MKRIWLVLSIAAVCVLAAVGATGWYILAHPETIKPQIERLVAMAVGGHCRIEAITCTVNPLRIDLTRLEIDGGQSSHPGLRLRIGRAQAALALAGSPTGWQVRIDRLACDDVTVSLPLDQVYRNENRSVADSRILDWVLARIGFRGVEIRQIEMSRASAAVSTGHWDIQIDQMQARVGPSGKAELALDVTGHSRKSDDRFDLPGISLAGTIAPSDMMAQFEAAILSKPGRLHIGGAEFADLIINLSVVVLPGARQLNIDQLSASASHFRFKPQVSKSKPLESSAVSFQGRGRLDMAAGKLHVDDWHLRAPALIDSSGAADLRWQPALDLDLAISQCRLQSDRLMTLVEGVEPRITFSGPIGVGGRLQIGPQGALQQARADLQIEFSDNPMTVMQGANHLSGRLDGRLNTNGRVSALTWHFNGGLSQAGLRLPGIALTEFALSAQAAGTLNEARIEHISMQAKHDQVKFDVPISLPGPLRMAADAGRIRFSDGGFDIPDLRIASGSLQPLHARLQRQGRLVSCRIDGPGGGWIDGLAGQPFWPAGWKASGRDALKLNMQLDPNGHIEFQTDFSLAECSFGNQDQTIVGETCHGRLTANGAVTLNHRKARVQVDLAADRGEMLLGRHYIDLSAHKLQSRGYIEYNWADQQWQIEKFRFSLTDLLAVDGSARMGSDLSGLDLKLDLTPADAHVLMQNLAIDPFKYAYPVLDRIDIGGQVAATMHVQGRPGQWRTDARLKWSDGIIQVRDASFAAHGVSLDVPLQIGPVSDCQTDQWQAGHLAVDQVELPFCPAQPLDAQLRACRGQLIIDDLDGMQTQWGTVGIGSVVCALPQPSAPWRVRTRIAIKHLDFSPLLKSFWPSATGGVVSGALDPVAFDPGRLSSRGRLEATAFGGQIDIVDPALTQLMTAVPAVAMDVSARHIDLAQLTQGTAFGRIDGMLAADIRNLEIVNRQPQRFDMRLESVERPGVDQRISVRAVDSIAGIGGGQSPFLGLAGGFVKLLKTFRYDKIGVQASLKNDLFRINGLVTSDGVEYLVKKRGISGIDVVNSNPDNKIRFKDMLKRLRRIAESRQAPVIQ